jgi:hypothetical protein
LATGFCANDGTLVDGAYYTVTNENTIDASDTFTYYDGCGFILEPGPTPGIRSFGYQLNDGAGNVSSASVSVDVQ